MECPCHLAAHRNQSKYLSFSNLQLQTAAGISSYGLVFLHIMTIKTMYQKCYPTLSTEEVPPLYRGTATFPGTRLPSGGNRICGLVEKLQDVHETQCSYFKMKRCSGQPESSFTFLPDNGREALMKPDGRQPERCAESGSTPYPQQRKIPSLNSALLESQMLTYVTL